MFRRRNQALPTTTSATAKRSSFSLRPSGGGGGSDGSARGIRLQRKSLPDLWREASGPTRASYVCLVTFLLCLYFGVRFLRYYNSHVQLDCQSADCRLSILPVGRGGKIVVDFPRRQLMQTYSVKCAADGTFVAANPPLDDDAAIKNRHNSKYKGKHGSKSMSSGHYKGPDANGHYFSYAIVLRERQPQVRQLDDAGAGSGEDRTDFVDLSALDPWTVVLPHGTRRLVMRQFRIAQSKRRVRTMITRVDSYIKRRRQRLIVKENGVPSWQGILLIVLGLVGFLLTLLIGQFWDEPPRASTGPGVRRQSQQHQQQLHYGKQQHQQQQPKRRSIEETRTAALQRTTPARYEVRTKPAAQNRFK